MIILRLAWRSLLNRWVTALLTILAIAVSVMLLLGVEKVRTGARTSFANTISGTDLIVGARSGDLQLLLYSVFRIGNATNNMTHESYRDIAGDEAVDWIVPVSLGRQPSRLSGHGHERWIISSATAIAATGNSLSQKASRSTICSIRCLGANVAATTRLSARRSDRGGPWPRRDFVCRA